MNPIQFECPYCRETNTGDESLHGKQVKCTKCQETILVPPKTSGAEPPTARLINGPSLGVPTMPDSPEEIDVFQVSPVARAYFGQILLALIFFALALGLEIYPRDLAWAPQGALVLFAFGVIFLLLVWIRIKARNYRLTTQRLFVRRGWLARHVDELELYRIKDVTVDQGVLQRLLGYGTITVLANDDTTPQVELVSVSAPTKIKEIIRSHHRAARQKENVHPAEFMRSP